MSGVLSGLFENQMVTIPLINSTKYINKKQLRPPAKCWQTKEWACGHSSFLLALALTMRESFETSEYRSEHFTTVPFLSEINKRPIVSIKWCYVKRSMPICLSTAHWKVLDSSKRFELMLFFSSSTTEEEHQLETLGRIQNFSVCCAKANGHWPFHIIPQYFSALRQLAFVHQ